MKRISLIAAVIAVVLVWGCNSRVDELEKQNTDLQSSNHQLSQDLSERDTYVDNVTQSINDVYNSLESVQAKERSILKESNEMEAGKKLTREEMRAKLLDRVSVIKSTLHDNQQAVADLQHKVNNYKTQYSGLKTMVANLKTTIEEREKSITELTQKIQGLESDVAAKTQTINEKEAVITDQTNTITVQHKQITTAYYVAGTRRELEEKGILKSEGGFLWGLLGSTSTLASGFDEKYFKPIDKTSDMTIQVKGKIDEVIPKRNETYFKKTEVGNEESMLTIADPNYFWQDKYLVIVTDKEN
ncbi:MAG TPA: hypothetical protein VL633_07255 [Bacteroidota bacterium]|jgi:outer membrane murein-binding lipoprotein Lpp|nr:hypothetical protein [Bacteroidota bacterium]